MGHVVGGTRVRVCDEEIVAGSLATVSVCMVNGSLKVPQCLRMLSVVTFFFFQVLTLRTPGLIPTWSCWHRPSFSPSCHYASSPSYPSYFFRPSLYSSFSPTGEF